jgi:hypothetical protein
MIRKLILVLTILALTSTPAFARGGGGGSHGGGGGFHGGGFHGGGFHGGFHGGEFHGNTFRGGHERFDRFNRFDRFHGFDRFNRFDRFHGFDRFHRFHRFGFFGDFGFVGPAFGFGVYPFYWDPFWFPSPYPAYTYAPPLVIQPEAQVSEQQPSSPAAQTYWYYCADGKAYYPYTQQCPGGWIKVPPTPAG